MPRENSFSDEDGRSLTPDLELPEGDSPPLSPSQAPLVIAIEPNGLQSNFAAPTTSPTPRTPTKLATFAGIVSPIDRFRASVRKVIHLHRTSTIMSDSGGVGAEPGIDPRRDSAYLTYGQIKQDW